MKHHKYFWIDAYTWHPNYRLIIDIHIYKFRLHACLFGVDIKHPALRNSISCKWVECTKF